MRVREFVGGVILVSLAAACAKPARVGPNGGPVAALDSGTVYAEVVADSNTGEVLVQIFDQDLKTRRPIETSPLTMGSGDHRVALSARPMDSDPRGMSSRFYGQADWARGGQAERGWIQGPNMRTPEEFDWRRGWEAGRGHDQMWEEAGAHRRMGPEHGPGAARPMNH
jgi:hypothetical protein